MAKRLEDLGRNVVAELGDDCCLNRAGRINVAWENRQELTRSLHRRGNHLLQLQKSHTKVLGVA